MSPAAGGFTLGGSYGDVAEIEVQVVVGHAVLVAVRPDPDGGEDVAGDGSILLDGFPRVQPVVAHAVDIGRTAPAMARGPSGKPVRRGAVAAVGCDVDVRANGVPEDLQRRRQQCDGTRHIAREPLAEPLRLADVDRHELPEHEVRRDDRIERSLPRVDLVEPARQDVVDPVAVAEHLARSQHAAHVGRQLVCIDDRQIAQANRHRP